MSKNRKTCDWPESGGELMQTYHDREWGVPAWDDRVQFEFLTLESAQAGLSWLTVLKKREAYRKAFADFDPRKVARFTPQRIAKLLANPGIIRNKLKVNAAVSNARQFLKLQDEYGSFCEYIWQFVGGKPIRNRWNKLADLPTTSPESDALSKNLKTHGFKFVGSTIIYAHMQATGLVNDHLVHCFRYRECVDLAEGGAGQGSSRGE